MHFSVSLSNIGNGQLILDNSDPQYPRLGRLSRCRLTDAFLPPDVGNYSRFGINGAGAASSVTPKGGSFQHLVARPFSPEKGQDLNDNGTLGEPSLLRSFFDVSPRWVAARDLTSSLSRRRCQPLRLLRHRPASSPRWYRSIDREDPMDSEYGCRPSPLPSFTTPR